MTAMGHSSFSDWMSTSISAPLQSLIESELKIDDPFVEANLGKLAIATYEQQLTIHTESISDAIARGKLADSLVEAAALKIVESLAGDHPADDIDAINAIPMALGRRAIWNWPKLPYVALCAGRNTLPTEERDPKSGMPTDARMTDLDEWYLL